jgi:epoxyqueuosine reductase
MIKSLKNIITDQGAKFKIIPIERLKDLKKDIENFKKKQNLNNFQKYIVNEMYKFDIPDIEFNPKSIIIIAEPNPAYAEVEFIWQGNKHLVKSLSYYDIDSEKDHTNTKKYLKNFLESNDFHIEHATNIPYKLLAVRSGLAIYGKNNICYIDGMGSFLTFEAFFTDFPCTNNTWKNITYAEKCSGCNSCLNNCPTNAIRDQTFLIDNERCLSYYNEMPGEFPEWIPLSAHNCIYDCLKCQIICPMNKKFLKNVIGPIKFNEQETNDILKGKQFKKLNPELRKKVKMLGMDLWLNAIPRNLKILFQQKK